MSAAAAGAHTRWPHRAVVVALVLAAACDVAGTPGTRPPATPAAAESVTAAGPRVAAPGAPDSIMDGAHARSGNLDVRVFFFSGERISDVVRSVRPATDLDGPADTLRVALATLVGGPTAEERAAGLSSFFSAGTRDAVRAVRIDDGTAIVDFHDFASRVPNASSSAGSTLLLAAMNATVFANSTVQSVEYRFDGSCDAFGEWVQRGCIRYRRDR